MKKKPDIPLGRYITSPDALAKILADEELAKTLTGRFSSGPELQNVPIPKLDSTTRISAGDLRVTTLASLLWEYGSIAGVQGKSQAMGTPPSGRLRAIRTVVVEERDDHLYAVALGDWREVDVGGWWKDALRDIARKRNRFAVPFTFRRRMILTSAQAARVLRVMTIHEGKWVRRDSLPQTKEY